MNLSDLLNIIIKVLQNVTKVETDLGQYIFVLNYGKTFLGKHKNCITTSNCYAI